MMHIFFRFNISLIFFVISSPSITAMAKNLDNFSSNPIGLDNLLAEENSKKSSRKPKKKRKKELLASESEKPEKTSLATDALANLRTFRGLIGIFMGDKSVLVFGAGATLPYSKTIALDGGFDYLKDGNEYASVSVIRFAAGAGYILPSGPDSTYRLGGRAGIMNFKYSYSIPPIFEDDEGISGSESNSALYVEGRLAYEVKMGGGLIAGAELQAPLYIGNKSASSIDSMAIYGSLGMSF